MKRHKMVARSLQQKDLVDRMNTIISKRERCMFLVGCPKFLGWLCEY